MAENATVTFSDPDGYAAGFGDARINLTVTGAGDFKARLTRLKLKDLEIYLCCENLPRIAYVSLPPEQMFLSFPVGKASLVSDGFALRNGDMILHGHGQRTHQRSSDACQWGLISLSSESFASCGTALTGQVITPPHASRILRPARAEGSRFRRLFRQACHLAEAKRKLIERPEVARALEQEMLHAIVNCLAASETDDNSRTRHRHAAIMVRFEETLSEHVDSKSNMPALCAEIGVPERSLRFCCTKFLGVSPRRYFLLRRLNKARCALRRADPTITSVAEVARNHQFLELGRFAVAYRTAFGESPSVTLQRNPQT
ncbi:AraC family transcriptional regulator [Bradyrhizobium sp. USDA 10063]